MNKKVLFVLTLAALTAFSYGCGSKKEDLSSSIINKAPSNDTVKSNKSAPEQHPNVKSNFNKMDKSVQSKEIVKKIENIFDKFPGEWKVSKDGTLSKGNYVENGNYKIVDAIEKEFNGALVAIYVGDNRVSSTLKSHVGSRMLNGYDAPSEVDSTMKSGSPLFINENKSHFIKVYIPLKSDDKTLAVLGMALKLNQ